MYDLIPVHVLADFVEVVLIDLGLASDNAVVIGLVVAGLAKDQRVRAILAGMVAAIAVRIALAAAMTQLLKLPGLLLAGGLLLLWVCWRMWRELRERSRAARPTAAGRPAGVVPAAPRKTLFQAAWQIVLSDVSLSADNVVAVAAAARENPIVLVFGLALSMGTAGLAAGLAAGFLQRYHWIAYAALVVILGVALDMTVSGVRALL